MGIFAHGEHFQVWLINDKSEKQPRGFKGQFPTKEMCYRYIAGKLP